MPTEQHTKDLWLTLGAAVSTIVVTLKEFATAITEILGTTPPPNPPTGDSLVVNDGQHITIASAASYPGGITVHDQGELTILADLAWGGDFLWMGKVNAVGEHRTRWIRAAGDMHAGDSTIVFNALPGDWTVGDPICISDSRYLQSTSGYATQTEDRTIAAIAGNTITLNAPLTYDHVGSRNYNSDLAASDFPIVDNLFTSIKLSSVPAKRGHIRVQWNHAGGDAAPSGTMRDVGLYRLGVTTVDPVTEEGQGGNERGKYPLHLHHIHEAGAHFIFDSLVIDGETQQEKWGAVLHATSGATFSNFVVRRMGGAGIVTEDQDAKNNTIDHCHCFDIRGNGNREDANIAALAPGSGGSGFYAAGCDNIWRFNVASSCVNTGGFVLVGNYATLGNYLGTWEDNESYTCKRDLVPWGLGADFQTYNPATPEQVFMRQRAWHISESAWYGYPVANCTIHSYHIRGASWGFDTLDYTHWNCRLINPDFETLFGAQPPFVAGSTQIDPSEQSFLLQGGRMACSSGCIPIETPHGPSTGSAPPRKTIIDGTLLDGSVYNIAASYNPSGLTTLSDRIEVRGYQGVAGDNFSVYRTGHPHFPAPCSTTRPKIIGVCCQE